MWYRCHKLEKMSSVSDLMKALAYVKRHVLFDEATHRYYWRTRPGGVIREYIGVSTYCSRYIPAFDNEYWSRYKAERLGVPQAEIKRLWDVRQKRALEIGKRIHAYLEGRAAGKVPAISSEFDPWFDSGDHGMTAQEEFHAYMDMAEAYMDAFMSEYVPLATESIVVNHASQVMGTIDVLYWRDGIAIRDYKTGLMKSGYGNLLGPFSDMDDSTVSKWTLQLNCYRQCLESMGIEVTSMEIIHFDLAGGMWNTVEIPERKIFIGDESSRGDKSDTFGYQSGQRGRVTVEGE
ncbi:MAG: hypothetical protein KatS3mg054_0066 [Chloroflexus sp.]|nr:MAG: hypothetical protein KatS3mg054_0066 [Chloroflexus sp.]